MTIDHQTPSRPAPRLARPEEADALKALVDAAYGHYVARMGCKPAPMLDDYAKRIADGQAWVVDNCGVGQADLIAGLLVLEANDDSLLIDNIAVAPTCKGRGLGRLLMQFAAAEAARRGFSRICLYTHVTMTENIAMYRNFGFRETHRSTGSGWDRVYFERNETPTGQAR